MAKDAENKLRPKDYWPNLKVIGCWTGGNSQTFIKELGYWYENIAMRDLGWLATEIRGSIPLWKDTNAGALTVHENFFEFVFPLRSFTAIVAFLLISFSSFTKVPVTLASSLTRSFADIFP